jgi:hypothetical protein
MRQETEYVGHIDVAPALTRAEIAYLQDGAFKDESGRLARGCSCPWLPTSDGRRLTPSQPHEEAEPAEWLRYLIAELLRPGASRSFRKELKGFSFDHHLDGMVVGCRRGNGELFAITAKNNRVRERVLRPATASYVESSVEPRNEPRKESPEVPRQQNRKDASRDAKVIPLRRYR